MPEVQPIMRTCRDCGISKAAVEMVSNRKCVGTICRKCNSIRSAEWQSRNKNRPAVDEDLSVLRVCRLCGQEKSLAEYPCRFGRRGRRCSECVLKENLEYQRANKDRYNAIKRNWEANNPEKARAAKVGYSQKPETKIKKRVYKSSRQEEINAQLRKQYANDPTPFNERNARRKRRERLAEGRFTAADSRALFINQNGKCANPQCQIDLAGTKYVADHIVALVHGGSHWPTNRQLLCARCNRIKGARTLEAWQDIISDPEFKQKWSTQ